MKKSATDLFEELRTWRNNVAETLHREPYMVLQNAVLLEIATKQPQNSQDLLAIRGMGKAKVTQFGHDILAIVEGEVEAKSEPAPLQSPLGEMVISVSELLTSINHLLSFQHVVVQGEIGSIDHRGRYTFFSLLDPREEALVNCFAWEDRLTSLGIELEEGMTVQVAGHPSIYKRTGRFTFEVTRVSLVGEGELRLAFERLKKRLSRRGYFDLEKKKPIPPFVHYIGLVTSSYADAKKDFLTHLGNFGFRIDFYHIRVEGIYAVDDIVRAINFFNRQPESADVIVLTRGGGSLESMQSFNTEEVAQAIFASRIPVITGIGHENDLSIADLVADRFASTPTDAGRLLSDNWRALRESLESYERFLVSRTEAFIAATKQLLVFRGDNMTNRLQSEIASRNQYLSFLKQSIGHALPDIFKRFYALERTFTRNSALLEATLKTQQIQVARDKEFLLSMSSLYLTSLDKRLVGSERLLFAHDPTVRLKQGYSIVRNKRGNVVKSSHNLRPGETLSLQFAKGSAETEVRSRNDK